VLKTQKRHLTQIERLKVKVESLQRSNLAFTSGASLPFTSDPTPISAPTTLSAPVSTGKKRRSPAEFDPLPSSTPRAIVAALPLPLPATTTATQLKARSRSTTPSKEKEYREDSLVALKPPALSPPPPLLIPVLDRKPLAVVQNASNVVVGGAGGVVKEPLTMSKGSTALKARLEALKAAKRIA
jgi:hypothetical protein